MSELTPPDYTRCQAEITPAWGGPFQIGAPRPQPERCKATPKWIATETMPGPDGLCGAMSLCDDCADVMRKDDHLKDRVRIDPIENKEEGGFKREERYIVVKLKDIGKSRRQSLRDFLRDREIPTRECVVAEPHHPHYEETWEAVRRWAEGRPQKIDELTAMLEDAQASMVRAEEERDAALETITRAAYYLACSNAGKAHRILREAMKDEEKGQ